MQKEITTQIIETVRKYPQNVKAALHLVADKNKMKRSTVMNMYYKKGGIRQTAPIFAIQTKDGILINTKSSKVTKKGKRTLKFNSQVYKTDGLTAQQKLALFDILFG